MILCDPDVEFRDDEGKGKRLHNFYTCDPNPNIQPCNDLCPKKTQGRVKRKHKNKVCKVLWAGRLCRMCKK